MAEEIKVVGLTGGIGTGKSTAAAFLKKKGFAHIDADQIGRDITADGSPMLPVLDELFGPTGSYGNAGVRILDEDGKLDRKALASIVFTDAEKKAKLDEVMFKTIIAEIDRQIEIIRNMESSESDTEKAEDTVPIGILLDAPLLFEAGLESRCDIVMLLVADEDVRIKRVCLRDDATEEEVRNRINSQMSDADKRKKSDIIVENSGTKEDLEKQLENFLKKYSKNS